MCGIFGYIQHNPGDDLERNVASLLLLSQSRGSDASGLAVMRESQIDIVRQASSPQEFVKTNGLRKALHNNDQIIALLGHTRMATDGTCDKDTNNQPVVKDGIVTIHNGIIVNAKDLWEANPDLCREYEVDTEILNSLLRKDLLRGVPLEEAAGNLLSKIKGAASVAMIFKDREDLLLFTNTGSLYVAYNNRELTAFASERFTLEQTFPNQIVSQIKAGGVVMVNLGGKTGKTINLSHSLPTNIASPVNTVELSKMVSVYHEINTQRMQTIKRCTKCILPETMPFISFDDYGVCNYCNTYNVHIPKGESILSDYIERYRKHNGIDCVVSFSGGRDSSYALHYVKRHLHLNPIAFSYDWGMLTDLGRRNQSIMTAELGIEHQLVSADIRKKRQNIKLNVEAWLSKPSLGTIPLFMAGDKQYFYYANEAKKKNSIDLLIMGENPLEKTGFKNGFAGVNQLNKGTMAYNVNQLDKIRMLFYYAKQFARNPAFLNQSLIDSFTAFVSYFVVPHTYLNLYDYIKWDEEIINDTLINTYGWETAKDSSSTWRIGDGTAAFYNYIYYSVAGFSEVDTFRSNQIREGVITRAKAMELTTAENTPRINSLEWYGRTINMDMEKAINRIEKIPKLY